MKDHKLYMLARKLDRLKSKQRDIEGRVKRASQPILEELERRRTKRIVSDDGIVVAYRQNEYVSYDERLLDKLPKDVRRRVRKISVDRAALEEEVMAGRVSKKLVAKYARIEHSRPWADVHIPKEIGDG